MRKAPNHGATKAELRFDQEAKAMAAAHDKFRAETNALLRSAYEVLKDYVDSVGGCDHSVGVCQCADIALLDKMLDHLVAEDLREKRSNDLIQALDNVSAKPELLRHLEHLAGACERFAPHILTDEARAAIAKADRRER